jgi:excisionase family DNA binding protein
VAALLHVSPKALARWAKEGKLPFMRTLGGRRRYPEAKIRELLGQLRENRRPESADLLDGPGSTAIGWSADGYGTGRLRCHGPCGPAVAHPRHLRIRADNCEAYASSRPGETMFGTAHITGELQTKVFL